MLHPSPQYQNDDFCRRIIAVWAFCEAGLGGLMHALKIPFTGIVLGGFSVLSLCLLSLHGYRRTKLVEASLLIMLVKFAASPQAPIQAYIAVGFQGLIAALLLPLAPSSRLMYATVGAIALAESALQRFFFLWLFMGKAPFQAFDELVKNVSKSLHLQLGQGSTSIQLIAVYTLLHMIWGTWLALSALRFPQFIAKEQEAISKSFFEWKSLNPNQALPTKTKKSAWLKWYAISLLLSLLVLFFFPGGKKDLLAIMLRSLGAIFLMFVVLRPLMRKWLERSSKRHKNDVDLLLSSVDVLRLSVVPAWFISKGKRGFNRLRYFMLVFMLLGLNQESNDTASNG
jgi:hypothetical protein